MAMRTRRIWVSLGAAFLLAACQASTATPTPGATPSLPTAAPTASPVPTATPGPAEHHIGTRVRDGVGEFFDRTTGDKFVPRGMNYVRLATQLKPDGSITFGHSLFDPGRYDSSVVQTDLGKMHEDGYNVVRVFLSPDTIGAEDGGLSAPYLANVADFLSQAKQSGIYVIFTLDWVPGGKYGSILSADCCSLFASMNANFLPPAGLAANQAFYQDFIGELLDLGAATDYVFSYQLRNELFFERDQPPLSLTAGMVTTANGKSYDMAVAADKTAMVSENLVYWIDEMRASILEVDPTALVSLGFFQPQEPNKTREGDTRLAVTEPAIWQSKADFIDLHPYAGFELNMKQYAENYGIKGMQEKPILMGEFGSTIDRYASTQAAAKAFVAWQVESCKYGFDGWLFWTWDSGAEQPNFFNALMDGGAINAVLSPVARPDPCTP
jgi:hypothetical protein